MTWKPSGEFMILSSSIVVLFVVGFFALQDHAVKITATHNEIMASEVRMNYSVLTQIESNRARIENAEIDVLQAKSIMASWNKKILELSIRDFTVAEYLRFQANFNQSVFSCKNLERDIDGVGLSRTNMSIVFGADIIEYDSVAGTMSCYESVNFREKRDIPCNYICHRPVDPNLKTIIQPSIVVNEAE